MALSEAEPDAETLIKVIRGTGYEVGAPQKEWHIKEMCFAEFWVFCPPEPCLLLTIAINLYIISSVSFR